MFQPIVQQAVISQALWVGECPRRLSQFVRGYNIKIVPWEALNQEQSPYPLVFLSPDKQDRFPEQGLNHTIVKNSHSKILITISVLSKKKIAVLPMYLANTAYEQVLSSILEVRFFLENAFKTQDTLRQYIKQSNNPIPDGLQDILDVVDRYDHPALVTDGFGRMVLKNKTSQSLLRGIYYPTSLSDLLIQGRFYLSMRGKETLISLKDVLKRHVFSVLFKSDRKFLVFVRRLSHFPFGMAYLLVFKDVGKFEFREKNKLFLDSRVVFHSMFHELGSPITSIGLGLELLEKHKLHAEVRQDLSYCQEAYARLKTLACDFPQFFSWESKPAVHKTYPVNSLLEDLQTVLSVQLKQRLQVMRLRQGKLFSTKKTFKVTCSRNHLFQAIQELVHFLLDFCEYAAQENKVKVTSSILNGKVYIDLYVMGEPITGLNGFKYFLSSTQTTVHQQSLGLREAIKHLYLVRITDLFEKAGFKLWIFEKKDGYVFRCESMDT